jgi:hypothetical protein
MGGSKKLLGLIVMGAAVVGMSSVAIAGKGGGGKPAPQGPASSITLNQSARVAGDLSFGQEVTFTTVVEQLTGGEYPMAYVECHSVVDGTLLYGMLDHIDVAFLLGGSWSPWWEVKSDGDCSAKLYAYGGRSKGVETPRLLAESEHFYVVGW